MCNDSAWSGDYRIHIMGKPRWKQRIAIVVGWISFFVLLDVAECRSEIDDTVEADETSDNPLKANAVFSGYTGVTTMNKVETGITLTVLFIIMIVSLVGNILVIMTYVTSKKLRGYVHLLILNLAVSDTLITCLSLPLRICQLFGLDWIDGFTSCSINIAFTIFFFTSTNFNLFLVTLDRYLGVIHPVKYRAKGSRKKVQIAIGVSWGASFVIGFLPLTGIGQQQKESQSPQFICTFVTVLHAGYVAFVVIFTLVIPWLVMIVMYSRVLKVGLASVKTGIRTTSRLREEGQPVPANLDKNEQRKMKKRAHELRLARAVFLVLTLYTICMVPIGIIDLIQIFSGYKFPEMVIKVALMLAYINPAVNPPIYAASIEHYRKSFVRLLFCRKWLKEFHTSLRENRSKAYRHSKSAGKTLQAGDERIPWKARLSIPKSPLGKKHSISPSNTSDFEKSFDDMSYEETTTAGGIGKSTLDKFSSNSLRSAFYSSTATLLSIILAKDELDQYFGDYGSINEEGNTEAVADSGF